MNQTALKKIITANAVWQKASGPSGVFYALSGSAIGINGCGTPEKLSKRRAFFYSACAKNLGEDYAPSPKSPQPPEAVSLQHIDITRHKCAAKHSPANVCCAIFLRNRDNEYGGTFFVNNGIQFITNAIAIVLSILYHILCNGKAEWSAVRP